MITSLSVGNFTKFRAGYKTVGCGFLRNYLVVLHIFCVYFKQNESINVRHLKRKVCVDLLPLVEGQSYLIIKLTFLSAKT